MTYNKQTELDKERIKKADRTTTAIVHALRDTHHSQTVVAN